MIVINGAGIAGLCLANCLENAGEDYLIVEKAQELSALGAGIILQSSGLAILDSLSLLSTLAGHSIKQVQLGNRQSLLSATTHQHRLAARCVERSELQRVLALKIPKHKILFETQISGSKQTSKSVQIKLSSRQVLSANFLINCAGIHSNLHAKPKVYDSGQWCWRTLATLKKPIQSSGEYWFGNQRIGISAVSDTKAYVFHVINQAASPELRMCSEQQRVTWILSKASTVKALENIDFENVQWIGHPLAQRQINWGSGRILAIGDAAHAMTPNLGQGAVLAMEDAVLIATLLINQDKTLAKTLQKSRHRRISRLQRQSLVLGNIAHHQSKAINRLLSICFKFVPLASLIRVQRFWIETLTPNWEGSAK